MADRTWVVTYTFFADPLWFGQECRSAFRILANNVKGPTGENQQAELWAPVYCYFGVLDKFMPSRFSYSLTSRKVMLSSCVLSLHTSRPPHLLCFLRLRVDFLDK